MNPQLINQVGRLVQKAWKPITAVLTTAATTVVGKIIKDKLDRKKYQEELTNKKTKKE